MLAALSVLRAVLVLDVVGLTVYRDDSFAHPGWAWALVGVLVAWSALVSLVYAVPARRTRTLLVADLGVAVALMALSPLVVGADLTATVPGFWVMAPLLAWAVLGQVPGGLLAGVVLAGTDLAVRAEPTQAAYGNVFLLLVGGPIVGFVCASLEEMSRQRDQAQRAAAADAERVRLARAVHDGVLQVLTLVQRRGDDLGTVDGERLARLAGEQEVALRALIRQQDAVRPYPGAAGGAPDAVDLAAVLARFETRPGVSVATPGGAVPVPADVGRELGAAVGACLDNVVTHVGPDAPAWVLLEAWPDRVEVSVRDDGPGIEVGRLEAAAAEGRLGVASSVRGRLHDLGGRAELDSGPHGTEWQLVVPLRPAARMSR